MRTKTFGKRSSKIEYFGSTWTGLGAGEEIQLEDIQQYSNGSGKFGKVGKDIVLTNIADATAAALKEGVDFQYDKRLDASTTEDSTDGFGSTEGGIIDTGTSGALATGKSLRFVDGASGTAKNIKSASGLNLKVYAKNLTTLMSPPSDRIYVDPLTGKFVLPRPMYWSNCNTSEQVSNGIIGEATHSNLIISNGIQVRGVQGILTPVIPQTNSLTVSLRKHVGCSYAEDFDCYYVFNPNVYIRYYSGSNVQLVIGGNVVASNVYAVTDSEKHLFFIYSSTGVKLYCQNTLVLDYTGAMPPVVNPYFSWRGLDNVYWITYIYIRHIRVWRDAITDVDFRTYEASNIVDSYHSIYNSLNNYQPKLISAGGVGYRYIPPSNVPASLPKPTASNEVIQLENVSDYSNGVGYFGVGHRIYDTDYTALLEGTDYVYDEAWDGSGTHAIDKYDDGVSGALENGKIIRVVHSLEGVAKNLTSADMGSMIPIVKNLPNNSFSPPANQFYIDPVRGKVIMPRPLFWSKLEDANSEIGSYTLSGRSFSYSTAFGSNIANLYPKFNKGLSISTDTGSGYSGVPLNITPNVNPLDKGTISFWHSGGVYHMSYGDESYSQGLYINIASTNVRLVFNSYGAYGGFNNNGLSGGLYNGDTLVEAHTEPIMSEQCKHYYIVFDKTIGIKLYVNGVLSKTFNYTWSTSGQSFLQVINRPGATWYMVNASFVDNLKIWQDYIDNPDWEYNSGTGREDALHRIYGATAGYKPLLASPGGVGYYKASGAGSLVRGTI